MQELILKLEKFWDIVVHVWNHGYLGVDIGTIIEAIAIVVLFLALRQVFAFLVISVLKRWVEKSKTDLDDEVLNSLEDPIKFVPVVLGIFLAGEHLPLSGRLDELVSHVVLSLVTFNIFWGLVRVVEPFSFLLNKLEKIFTPAMVQWIKKGVKLAFVFLGGAAILETWGIKVGPLVAGLGLFGVAVALGAQDMFKNLIGGFLVIAEKRFHPGDWIKVDGIVEGTVEDIGFRSTMIRRFDKAPVYVPNSKLADNAVTNFSAMTHRRIYWMIGVEYDTTIEQLKEIRDGIYDFVASSADFADPEEVSTFVRIDSFNDSSIDIMLYCFTRTTNWGEWLEVKEQLAYKVKDIVESAGTGFAFPSRSIYVDYVEKPDVAAVSEEARPEAFVPPVMENQATSTTTTSS